MTTVDQAIADQGLRLPEVITGYVGGQSVPVKPHANQHAVYFPGTGEQIASLQEDDAAAVVTAVACARTSFESGEWSNAATAARQSVFRRAANLIRARPHGKLNYSVECWVSKNLDTGSINS